jgi:hypothetical protein
MIRLAMRPAVAFEPADGLAQDGAPASASWCRSSSGSSCLRPGRRSAGDHGADEDDDHGDQQISAQCARSGGLRGLAGHQVDEAAEIPDQADVEDAVADEGRP